MEKKISLLAMLLLAMFFIFFLLNCGSSESGGQIDAQTDGEDSNETTNEDSDDDEQSPPNQIEPIDPSDVIIEPITGIRMLKNEFLIKFIDTLDSDSIEDTIDNFNCEIIGGIKNISVYHVRMRNLFDILGIWDIVAMFVLDSNIEFVSPIFQVGMNIFPQTDPIWDEWDTDYPDGNNWALEIINAPQGWDYTIGSRSVNIGVVDFGFDTLHEDLHDNIGFISRDENTVPIDTDHGTIVSSIIAATGNNGIGMTGVMWNANLMLFESSNWSHSIYFNILNAVLSGSKVVNLSAGINWLDDIGRIPSENNGYDYLLIEYFNFFLDLVLQEISKSPYDALIIQSAGNDNIDAKWNLGVKLSKKYPNNYIVVSAIDKNRNLYGRSNYGPLVTVSAPGVDILAGLSNNKYSSNLKGTSCSAPYVTGLAGLLLSLNPSLSSEQIVHLITDGASENVTFINNEEEVIRIIDVKKSFELLVNNYE